MKRVSWAAFVPLLAALAGCGGYTAETAVVVVVESDVAVPADVDSHSFTFAAGPKAPGHSTSDTFSIGAPLVKVPVAAEFLRLDSAPNFSVTVQLSHGFIEPGGPPPTIAVVRTVTDIRFTDERTMMLVVPIVRACACEGTSCPALGNPDCENIAKPTLQPFDPALADSIEFQLLVSHPA